jgi:hypothetical protein
MERSSDFLIFYVRLMSLWIFQYIDGVESYERHSQCLSRFGLLFLIVRSNHMVLGETERKSVSFYNYQYILSSAFRFLWISQILLSTQDSRFQMDCTFQNIHTA